MTPGDVLYQRSEREKDLKQQQQQVEVLPTNLSAQQTTSNNVETLKQTPTNVGRVSEEFSLDFVYRVDLESSITIEYPVNCIDQCSIIESCSTISFNEYYRFRKSSNTNNEQCFNISC